MSFARLILCVSGVYAMFLLWAIAQERLSVPFQTVDGTAAHKFRSPLFMGTLQSFLSCLSALTYILIRRKPGQSLWALLGLDISSNHAKKQARIGTLNSTPDLSPNGTPRGSGALTPNPAYLNGNGKLTPNGSSKLNGSSKPNGINGLTPASFNRPPHSVAKRTTSSLLLYYLRCSLFITSAAPFGFASLSYISYPTLVLGKSCKLVPVMLMNLVLYRRKFAAHKYLVVAMVTIGITMFMHFGGDGKGKAGKHGAAGGGMGRELIGITYLLINLALDGATNSTQDHIFSSFHPTGAQMMFFINLFSTLLTLTLSLLPLPYIPVLHPSEGWGTEFWEAVAFLRGHNGVVQALGGFAITGALGQLFIFETLEHFGSLTLVTITLTRKLFTMLLSVVLYNHSLTQGQWLGAAVVFAGICVEAWVKRRDVHAKRVIQEKEKAKIKSL
ncbi:hypothetical protein JAAARDRAFT_170441 [Jaapia argillacea MUCL 33604]|uniref:UDP-galactose transporter homolog 1 n=1 Tax=Jaapia argillacea MUCL 33604 TaxID=933084 RepID=A0A067QFB9_9AGAM|nr:hypothetical protein JAAARDRAFT_170441 [Jaapia argillacea MUCL 33604]